MVSKSKMESKALMQRLTLIPMVFFPTRGGGFCPTIVNIVDGLPYSLNWASCKAVMFKTCAGYFISKEIGFVALAIKISSYRIFELRQNSMQFVKKSHRWRVEMI